MAADRHRRIEGREDLLDDPGELARHGQPFEQQDEFVPAKATDGIGLPQASAQTTRNLHDQGVADAMAKRVVDPLELVEIEKTDGDEAILP